MKSQPAEADVFISYSRRDVGEVQRIAHCLESAGVSVWVDIEEIEGGANYGLKISRGIQACRTLMLICSNASMESRNVKQEIQLAWRYERPYMPLLLEPIRFPEQIEYWLEGWQWIEVLGKPPEHWLPKVMRSLELLGVVPANSAKQQPSPTDLPGRDMTTKVAVPGDGLKNLRKAASFTDRIWPLPADKVPRDTDASRIFRGLGAPQDHVRHDHRIGTDVCLAIETSREGHLLLLDEGPEGIIYCLCPSWFAPDPFLSKGRHYLPQRGSRYDAFRITGTPGREHLLAIISDHPLDMNWMPADPSTPARVLNGAEIETLLSTLRTIEPNSWVALATYFDIAA